MNIEIAKHLAVLKPGAFADFIMGVKNREATNLFWFI
jgi:hypothetical protein